MTLDEIVAESLLEITGGKVCSEIDVSTAKSLALRAFKDAIPWFCLPSKWKTFAVVPTGNFNGYIDYAKEGYNIRIIENVYPVREATEYTADLVRDLLSLPAAPLETKAIEEIAAWNMTFPMVRELLGQALNYDHVKEQKRIYLNRVEDQAVTLVFNEVPSYVEQVENPRHLNWIQEMATARISYAIGKVRSKFRGGAIRFETDGSDMVSEAKEAIRQLKEDVKEIGFEMKVHG
jgi:hypothetical protein